MCIRVLVNNYKERLEQMQFVKMSQLIRQNSQLNKTNIKMYLFITYFNMVDFSAIKIAIFWIKIDLVLTKKYPIHYLWLSSFGAHWHINYVK